MTARRVIVVGGGAAGLMAAGQAAMCGAQVLILEKMKHPGRKLRITGKGRCNITNIADLRDFIDHFSGTGRFLHQAFSLFFSKELIRFFNELGLETVTERGGRVFPAQGRAEDVLATMLGWIDSLPVTIRTDTAVKRLVLDDRSIAGVETETGVISGDAVILATGGASYPATGSTGDGYTLAAGVGHSIVPIRPALVPLETKEAHAMNLDGLSLKNVGVRLFFDKKKKAQSFGEMGFTKFGITGPVILTLSGSIVDALQDGKSVSLSIDLKPALDDQKLNDRLLREFSTRSREPFSSVLRSLLPKELVPVCLTSTNISGDKPAHQITSKERSRLRIWLKNFPLEITGFRPIREAIVTAGGVDTGKINPSTMESRLISGLYICGELLNIHADTGGYNLQAAFSTGWLAGRAASGRLN